MSEHMQFTRRQALAAISAGVLTASAGAAEPPVRTGRPFFKLSLAAYSFNSQLPKNWPKPGKSNAKMSLLDFIDFCAEQDLDAAELTSYYFPAEVTPEYLNSVKERCFRLGLDISGTAIGNDFCKPDGPDRDFEVEMTKKWIDYASFVGAPVIRIFAGNVPKGDTEEAALDRCIAGIDDAVAYAATKGVVLALENHGGITATPDQLLKIVERVKPSPWFGINFDSGNFRTEKPYDDLEKIAPFAVNAQVKVAMSPGGKKEPADMKRIVEILRHANYRGYLVLEYEEPEDPRVEIPKYLKTLRELIA
jgi:sugar phosphate isomerase/epimerase